MKRITLLLALLLMITACNNNTTITAKNLMAGINRNDITPIAIDNPQKSSTDKATEITNSFLCAAPTEPKIVNLDRPFSFIIMDSELNMPIFMGALNDVT